MKIEICGRDYDKLPIIEKLAWFIVYPFIAVLVGVMVLCFIFPLLIVFLDHDVC